MKQISIWAVIIFMMAFGAEYDLSSWGGVDKAKGVLSGNIFLAFTELKEKYRTDLEQAVFLSSPEAKSYVDKLSAEKANLSETVLCLKVQGAVEPFVMSSKTFKIKIKKGLALKAILCDESEKVYLGHTGLGFETEKVMGMTSYDYLSYTLTENDLQKALAFERIRENLTYQLKFQLAGITNIISKAEMGLFAAYTGGMYIPPDTNEMILPKNIQLVVSGRDEGKVIYQIALGR